jgi:hypothetical protein
VFSQASRVRRAHVSRLAPASNAAPPSFVRHHPQKISSVRPASASTLAVAFKAFAPGSDFGSLTFEFLFSGRGSASLREQGVDKVRAEVGGETVFEAVAHRAVIEEAAQVSLVGAQAKRQFAKGQPGVGFEVRLDVGGDALPTSGNNVFFVR